MPGGEDFATVPRRPALRWHGGKWRLAPWIIAHLPPHRCYVEPFGGAASVLLRKKRAHAEIYNDLDQDVVNLFRALRDPGMADRLRILLSLTPFARAEFEAAYRSDPDPVEQARLLVVRSFMGFGSDGTRMDVRTGFRNNSTRSGTTPASDWANYPAALHAMVSRLRGVVIENRQAADCMRDHDGQATLHYVDPPYRHDTRRITHRNHGYNHEMDDQAHGALLEGLRDLAGMVVLSGYPSAAYDAALPGWTRRERHAMADGARPRVEVLWLNPAAAAQLSQGSLSL